MKLAIFKRSIAISAFSMVALLGINGTADAQRRQDQPEPAKAGKQQQDRTNRQQPAVNPQKRGDNDQRNTAPYQRENTARQKAIANQRAEAQRQQALANQRAALERQREAQRQEQIRLEQQRQEQLRRQAQYNNRYRVYRNGGYYQTDHRGAELLKQAVNRGYQQGFEAGQADRRNRRNSNYYNSSIYRSGNYGYQRHVDSRQYQCYFQQGFEKGYQDGYNSRYQYGQRNNNGLNILGAILNGILNLQNY